MENRIKKVMSAAFGIDGSQINDTISSDKLGQWDSLSHMILIIALEEEFNIKFSSKEIVEMVTYPLIKSTIQKKLHNDIRKR